MILNKIHHNRLGAYSFMFLCVVVFWIKSFFTPQEIVWTYNSSAMPLWELVKHWGASSGWLSSSLSLLFGIVLSFNLARLNTTHQLLSRQSLLLGVIYVIMVGGVVILQKFNPIWIVALFMLSSVSHVVSHSDRRKTMKACFNSSLLIGISSLFYINALLLFPMILGVIITMRMLSFKSFQASILGLISPWIIIFGIFLLQDKVSEFLSIWSLDLSPSIPFHPLSIYAKLYFGAMGLFLFFALGSVMRYYSKKKVFARKLYLSFVWMTFYLMAMILLPFVSFEIYPLFAIWAAILIAHFFDVIGNKFWQETLFILFLLIAIGGQILM
ncbi:hypothetical protein OAA06_00265 [bacterium]|nr:hypothetical protein [bacterium]